MKPHITLKDRYKSFTLDQDKIISPRETVRRFKERTQSLDIDILDKTVRIDNGRLDIPVFFSLCGADALNTIGTKKQMGKGATPEQAEASAVMELAERYSFFSFCKDESHFFQDTYRNVRKNALPFEMITRSVHDTSDDLPVARRIFEELPLQWTWGFNLTQSRPVLIPFNWFYAINEFNGPSAGNCIEEALIQGICEIIERHTSSLVSHGRLDVPGVRGETADDPMVRNMLMKYANAGIKVFISDFSLDTGIPTVGVLAFDPSTFPSLSEIVWTAGTTPNPQKALSRALTEVAQLAGDFNTGANYVASGLPKFSDINQADFILKPKTCRDIGQLPDQSNDNLRIEIENCLSALSRNRMEVLTIETTHPRLEIPAFYSIIPGAHFRERAQGTSVAMFTAKLIRENYPPAHAMERLTEMDRQLPSKYYLQFYLGACALELEDYDDALGYFNRALELDPHPSEMASIYSYMGVCLKDMGRYREALDILRRGEAQDAERTDIYNLMGFCHFKLKEHVEAIACFENVLRLNPSSAIDYANIASNYRELGDREKAVRFYRLALELDPSIDFARENLAKLSA